MQNYTFSAVPTPFLNGKIDYKSLKKFIDFQTQSGIKYLVLSGSTGEGHNLTQEEWIELIKFGVENKNDAKIVAGVGFNSTFKAVEYAKKAQELEADYILATTPYYNKPQQDGIYAHFRAIHDACDLPIILYNVPGRTATDMNNETITKLSQLPRIIGLKDATGKLERVVELRNMLRKVRPDFLQFSGEDATQIGFNAMGGNGVISVVSNIAPNLCLKIQELCEENNFADALKNQNELFEIAEAMFCEVNPVPVKYALYKMGIFASAEVRLPLIELTDKNKQKVDEIVKKIK